MNLQSLSHRDRNLLVLLIAVTWFVYSRYYGYQNFHDYSPFTRPRGAMVPAIEDDSSGFALLIPGFEGQTLKFFFIHGLPFLLSRVLIRDWTIRKSFTLSASVWTVVYLYSAFFRFSDFMKIHPGAYQCAATLVTTYPLMGLSMVLGHLVGALTGTAVRLVRRN